EFIYWSDDGELVAIRVQDWKVVFKEWNKGGVRRKLSRANFRRCGEIRVCPQEPGGITQHIEHASRQLERPLSLDSGLRLRSVALGCARLSPRVMPARSPNAHTTAWCRGAGRGRACPPSVCSAA